jgi:hypothetical protein
LCELCELCELQLAQEPRSWATARTHLKLAVLLLASSVLQADLVVQEMLAALAVCKNYLGTQEVERCLSDGARALDGHLRPGSCTMEKVRLRATWLGVQCSPDAGVSQEVAQTWIRQTFELVWHAYQGTDACKGALVCLHLHMKLCESVTDPGQRRVVRDTYAALQALPSARACAQAYVAACISNSAPSSRDILDVLLYGVCPDLGLVMSFHPEA